MRDARRGTGVDTTDDQASSALRVSGLPVSLWGVLNITPDSFSDGGVYLDPARALARAEELVREGADVIDVGGESTRPPGNTYGAPAVVDADEELRRVAPVVEALARRGLRVSVDTQKAEVAERVLALVARVINDVSGGRDLALLAAVARSDAELVLMHNRGRGERAGDNVRYTDVVLDVRAELSAAVARAEAAGVPSARIWLDPGIGFAKTTQQSLRLLAHLPELCALGFPVLVGTSRKSFIAESVALPGLALAGVHERLGGSVSSAAIAVFNGARAIRAHDVALTRQAISLALAMREARA